jgi:cytochrome c-type biogenesis protein CcmH
VPRLIVLLIGFALAAAAHGAENERAAAAANLEARAMALESELRCLVCQNQTLADSNAPLAIDLRNQIREKMQAGASERDIVDFLVGRYGDFVLYRPRFTLATLPLWLGPIALMIAGLGALYWRLARGRKESDEPQLSPDERVRASALLEGDANRSQHDTLLDRGGAARSVRARVSAAAAARARARR